MGRIKAFSKRRRRYVGAVIAAIVTTLVALFSIPDAEAETCSLSDATQWQLALRDSSVEQTPAYIRGVTEAFLEACPSRPEAPQASQIAGIAAADLGDAKAAATHFRNAEPIQDLHASFYAMSAYWASGAKREAWQLRNRTVAAWFRRLDRHPGISITPEITPLGTLYEVTYTTPDAEAGVRVAWVAVPAGPGWPAALTFSNDRYRMFLRQARSGGKHKDLQYVDLERCDGRRTLGQITDPEQLANIETTAKASLKAYLANPDMPKRHTAGPVAPCVWPSRLLPGVPKS